jgi:hypothetical protein
MTYDGALWGALACTLSALIGVVSWQRLKTRGIAAGVRGAAWMLLPIAAWLTGTLRLLTEVLSDVGHWATRLVFSPAVWLGIVLAGVSVVLFGISTRLGPKDRPAKVRKGSGTKAVKAKQGSDPEMDDIEAILRKHGIS